MPDPSTGLRDRDLAVRVAPALDLVALRHAEPHRRHHGPAHLAQVVRDAGALATAAGCTDAAHDEVVLAGWFHDAVYEPGSPTNEADSAALARRCLEPVLGPARTAEVERLVLLTAGHEAAAEDLAGAALLDADLAILAAPPQAYAAYVAGVRAEHAHVDDAAWVAGRSAFLASFLARGPLYRLDARDGTAAERDARARENLGAELARLRSPGPGA